MKKYLSIIVGLCLIGMIAFVCFTGKKEENDLRKIRVAEVTHSPFYTPFYVAIENGYFKEEGLDIELVLTPGADKVSAAVLSNDVEIGFAGPEASIYVYNGGEEDYIISFAGLTKRDGQFILAREATDNFKLEDLYNKEILVGRKGGMPSLNFLNALKKSNIDPKKININYSVEFAALSGSFIGGIGNYVNLFEPTATKLTKDNLGYVVASIGLMSGEVPYTAFNARKSFINNNEDVIRKFTKALNKGIKYTLENNEIEIAKVILKQFPDSSLNDLSVIIKRYKDYDCFLDSTYISEKSFENLEDIMIDNDLLKSYVPYSDLIKNYE
ncbi:MAG: ABC transporter substrate-binding protein [Bacilli bacterium]|nr:ABC transporter substrate-binding protein [Bacilli bacterium]